MGRAERRAMERENRKMMSVGTAKTGIAMGFKDGYRKGYNKGLDDGITTLEAAYLLALRDVLGLGPKRMDAVREQVAKNVAAMSTKDPDGEYWMSVSDVYETVKDEVYKGKMRTTEDICKELSLIE